MTETPMQRYRRLREEEGAACAVASAYDPDSKLQILPAGNNLSIGFHGGNAQPVYVTEAGARWLIRELTRIVGPE